MTDNSTLSPQGLPDDQHAAPRPSVLVGFVALLVAPLAATIVTIFVFHVGARIGGYRPASSSLQEWVHSYLAFALVFVPLGGLLMFLFWRKAPIGPIPSTTAGAVLGGLFGYICALVLQLPDETLPGVLATVCLGAAGGVAGGLAIWLICRLGSKVK